MSAAFTICAYNYFSKALSLYDSFRLHHPDDTFYIFIVGKKSENFYSRDGLNVVFVEDLKLIDFYKFAFKFDVIEFSTYLKPILFQHLLSQHEFVFYIDPDILFFSSLDVAKTLLSDSTGVLTPHTFTPIDDDKKPADLDFSRFGSFNLGFIGLRRTPESASFLKWWQSRLASYGFYDPQSGMAVDQKWIDLAFVYFKGFKVIESLGYNVAFWNLHERLIGRDQQTWKVNGLFDLVFVHFSSYDNTNEHVIANKQSRFLPGSRPDFSAISLIYQNLLKKNDSGFNQKTYCYDYFESGARISNTLRRIYANHLATLNDINPFLQSSKTYQFAKRHHLLSSGTSNRANFKAIGAFSRIQSAMILSLKIILRVLGPDRYYMLMRYLAHISSFHNQSKMFKVK